MKSSGGKKLKGSTGLDEVEDSIVGGSCMLVAG